MHISAQLLGPTKMTTLGIFYLQLSSIYSYQILLKGLGDGFLGELMIPHANSSLYYVMEAIKMILF